jgi:GTP-binding protein HflX
LVECFKSTLDEIREADMLLHVIDISKPNFADQINIVTQTLNEIGAGNKNTIMVFNKIDQLQVPDEFKDEFKTENDYLSYLKNTWMGKENNPCVFISAAKKININELRLTIAKALKEVVA